MKAIWSTLSGLQIGFILLAPGVLHAISCSLALDSYLTKRGIICHRSTASFSLCVLFVPHKTRRFKRASGVAI